MGLKLKLGVKLKIEIKIHIVFSFEEDSVGEEDDSGSSAQEAPDWEVQWEKISINNVDHCIFSKTNRRPCISGITEMKKDFWALLRERYPERGYEVQVPTFR